MDNVNETVRDENVTNQEQEQEEKTTYTEEEFQSRLQSETDKRVTEGIKTAQAKWEKEFAAKLEAEKNEAARMAKMTEAQRKEAELKKKEEEFEEERKKFNRERIELEVIKELGEKNLSTKFSSFLMGENAETSLENIQAFEEEFNKAVQKEVEARLGGEPPKKGNTNGTMSKEDILKIADDIERQRVISENLDLFK
mgnify:CR=1 FL=1